MASGRGCLCSIDKLPEECQPIVQWASQELANFDRTQVDVYNEFRERLIALQGEQGLDFDIPHFRSFSRYSVKLANISRSVEQARKIAATLADRFDATGSDDLTIIAAEAIKALILDTVMMSTDAKLSPKAAMELATALKQLAAAQASSANRRMKLDEEAKAKKVEVEMKANAEKALDLLSKEPGVSSEAIARARRDFLGIRPKVKSETADG